MSRQHAPLISIIIPCYNAEKYVREAIQSALDQTWPNLEVIVVDDGSTDGSLDVIRSFSNRIRHATGPNRGGCAARNQGLSLARGEYIQFLDADDLLYRNCVEAKFEWRLGSPSETPACDVLYRSLAGQDRTIIWELRDEEPVCAGIACSPLVCAPLHTAAELRAVGGFRENLRIKQEVDLHVRMAMNGTRFVRLPETLAVWRQTPGSVSSDALSQQVIGAELLGDWADLLAGTNSLTEHRAQFLARQLALSARNAMQRGDFAVFRAAISKAQRLSHDGWLEAYANPLSRIVVRTVGPQAAEPFFSAFRGIKTACLSRLRRVQSTCPQPASVE